jgi:hypothetical protein
LINENQSVKVLKIRELTPEEIEKNKIKGTDEIQAKGYCVVELEFYWNVPMEKPNQKVFPYPLPTLETEIRDGSSEKSNENNKVETKE